MKHKGESIKDAIKFLDSFYKDIGLMFSNLESLLSEKGFLTHPSSGNKATYYYDLSTHIGWSNRWTLKNIQRIYLHESDIKKNAADKAIICLLSLYPLGLFSFPILVFGVMKYKNNYSLKEIWDFWLWGEFCKIDTIKGNWRLINIDKASQDDSQFSLELINNKDKIEKFTAFFLDMIKIENSTILAEKIVEPLVDLFEGESEVILDNNLLIKPIPANLFEIWKQKEEADIEKEE